MGSQPPKIKLAIGLGNPSQQYQNTYHNAGSLFVDYVTKKQFPSDFGLADVKWLKSKVYMNNSGSFVLKMLKDFNVRPAEILIIHDDSDIVLGQYKMVFGRGSAGHHGVESIVKRLKTKNFWRLRIGIRRGLTQIHPPKFSEKTWAGRRRQTQKAEEFVLKKISSADKKILESVFQKILISKLKDLRIDQKIY